MACLSQPAPNPEVDSSNSIGSAMGTPDYANLNVHPGPRGPKGQSPGLRIVRTLTGYDVE